MAGMVLSLTYLKVVQLLQPFTDPWLNQIKETSLWQIFFVFLIALLIEMNDVDRHFLTVCLMLAFFINFIVLGVQWLLRRCGWWSRDSLERNTVTHDQDVNSTLVKANPKKSNTSTDQIHIHKRISSPFHINENSTL